MTEYLYSLSLARQTQAFLMSLGFGFIMGIFYDVFRIIRLCISKGRVAFIITDMLYCIFLCFCTFLFFLTVNEGEIRAYILIGEASGFAVYYFSLGAVIFSVSERIIFLIKKTVRGFFKIIFFPFKWIFGKIRGFFNKFVKKSRKSSKNIKNKSNFLLKVNKQMLYNLFYNKKKTRQSSKSSENGK